MQSSLLLAASVWASLGTLSVIAAGLLLAQRRGQAIIAAVAISVALVLALLPTVLHSVFGVVLPSWYRPGSDALIGAVEFWQSAVIYRIQRRGATRR